MNVARLYSYGFPIPRPTGMESRLQWDLGQELGDKDLAKSGLVMEDIGAYPAILNQIRPPAHAGYVIPYKDVNGKWIADEKSGVSNRMYRTRLFYPVTLPKDTLRNSEKCPKYHQLSRQVLGELTGFPYLLFPKDPQHADTCFVVEGEKKAAAMCKRWGVRVIGIPGCSSWRHWVEDRLHPAIEEYLTKFAIKDVVIIPDGDIGRPEINRQYRGLAEGIEELDINVTVKNFSLLAPDKLDDWLVANPLAGIEVVDEWEDFPIMEMEEPLDDIVTEYGLMATYARNSDVPTIIPNEYNTEKLLVEHPRFKGRVRWNADKQEVDGGGDKTVFRMLTILQRRFNISRLSKAVVKSSVIHIAGENEYSPLREWLDGLVWDRVRRLERLFIRGMGAEDNPYNREVSLKSMAAAVARRSKPGCMVDYMVILRAFRA